MNKNKKPSYSIGQTVYLCQGQDHRQLVIKENPKWNGYTFMYSFEGTDLRCGENYISAINPFEDLNITTNQKQTGTITWFKIEDHKPPLGTDNLSINNKWSIEVLITNYITIDVGFFVYDLGSFSHRTNWKPTHWAFINYPE